MKILSIIPILFVLPTFAFIAYWLFRYVKTSKSSRLPRSAAAIQRLTADEADKFTYYSNRLRWLNLWLMIGFLLFAFGLAIYNG